MFGSGTAYDEMWLHHSSFVLFFFFFFCKTASIRYTEFRHYDREIGCKTAFLFFVSSKHASFATSHSHIFQLFKYNLGLFKGLTVSIEHL